jgi:putative transposase
VFWKWAEDLVCDKRHLLVDTPGIPLSIYVTPADVYDGKGAHCLLAGLAFFVPRLKKNLGRRSLPRAGVSSAVPGRGGWKLEVVERASGTRGFALRPASGGPWSEHMDGFPA